MIALGEVNHGDALLPLFGNDSVALFVFGFDAGISSPCGAPVRFWNVDRLAFHIGTNEVEQLLWENVGGVFVSDMLCPFSKTEGKGPTPSAVSDAHE